MVPLKGDEIGSLGPSQCLRKPGKRHYSTAQTRATTGAQKMFNVLYILFAAIGATLILGALVYVNLVIGGLVQGMVVLIAGPLIDKIIEKRKAKTA
jgi:uncharacterized membrane protein